mgnify:CR=1 FL=1
MTIIKIIILPLLLIKLNFTQVVVSGPSMQPTLTGDDVNGYEYELREATECILQGKNECEKFPFVQSEMLCKTMDALRASWNFVYPFECCKN